MLISPRVVAVTAMVMLSLTPISGTVKTSYAAVQEIAAVVNDDAVSMRDLVKRMKLVIASSGLPSNTEIKQKLAPQVLGSLINEKLMLQEAQKLNLAVTPAEIEQGFATIAGQNKLKPDEFKTMLMRGGIELSTIMAQVEAQVAWSKVVQAKLRPRVVISDRDVEAALERITAKIGTTEYLAAEIFLPIDDPKKEGDVKQLASKLVGAIKSGQAGFFKLAQQFSKAAGAVNGGDTGWLHEAQLDADVLAGLKSIEKNQVTKPIKTLTGYHIYYLRDTRALSKESMPSRDQIRYTIGNERLEKLQNRHLSDLRNASFVEIRV